MLVLSILLSLSVLGVAGPTAAATDSPPADAGGGAGTPRIVINELHYHPNPDSVAGGIDPELVEFLELTNADTLAIELTNWSISDGVTFFFAAGTTLDVGDFMVIARDAVELQLNGPAIPPGVAVFQWAGGALSNGGERVALMNEQMELIDEVTYGDDPPWPNAADGDGPSLELVNPVLPNEHPQAWAASATTHGTPGATNSTFGPPAPLIVDVVHSPPIPAGNDDVTITAVVVADSVDSVALFHRRDAAPSSPYNETAMVLSAADTYTAVVTGLADGERLDFHIKAFDPDLNETIAPAGHPLPDPLGNPSQAFLCKFSNDVPAGDFPTYHVIFTEANRVDQEDGELAEKEYDATFIDPAGNIFYNVTQRFRGSSSLNQLPHSYRVNFSDGQTLQSELGFPVTRLNLMAQNTHRQALGYGLFASVGGWSIPTSKTQFVRFDLNPTNNDGNLLDHVYINVERADGDFLDSQNGVVQPLRFPDDSSGNLYRGRNSAILDYRGSDPDAYRTNEVGRHGYQKVTNEEDDEWDDLITLCRALDVTETPDSLFQDTVEDLIDVDEWCRWFAVHMVLGNREGGIYRDTGDDYYLYFHPQAAPNGYRATFIPWDMDSVFGGFNEGQFVFDETIWRTGDVDGDPAAPRRFLRSNAFAPIFVKAIREIIDNDFTADAMFPIIDALPEEVADATVKQELKDFVTARRAFIEGEIVSELTLDISAIPEPYTDPEPAILLFGLLNQAGTHKITVNGAKVDSFNVFDASWSFPDTLHFFGNHYTIQALGRNDEVLEQIQHTITYLPPNVGLDFDAPAPPGAPAVTRLLGAAPNPFGSRTVIRYDLAEPGRVRLRIFDVHGRLSRVLLDLQQQPGHYSVPFDALGAAGRRLSAGVYFYELEAPGLRQRRKALLLR